MKANAVSLLLTTVVVAYTTVADAQALVPVDTLLTTIRAAQFSSPSALFAHLRIAPKGEFETSDKFASRVAHTVGNASYVFRVSTAADPGFCDGSIEYDADLGRLTYHLPQVAPSGADAGVPIQCSASGRDSYVASNAMGAKIRVTRYARTITELTTENEHFLFAEGALDLKPDDARVLKPNVRLAVLVTPGSSMHDLPAQSTTGESEPEFQNPYDITDRVSAIRAEQTEALLYDVRTGKILSRAKPPEVVAPAPVTGRTVKVMTIRYQDAYEKPKLLTGPGGDGHVAIPSLPGVQGFADVAFDILNDGTVANVVVKNSSDARLNAFVVMAVGNRVYSPGKVAGQALAVAMQQTISIP